MVYTYISHHPGRILVTSPSQIIFLACPHSALPHIRKARHLEPFYVFLAKIRSWCRVGEPPTGLVLGAVLVRHRRRRCGRRAGWIRGVGGH